MLNKLNSPILALIALGLFAWLGFSSYQYAHSDEVALRDFRNMRSPAVSMTKDQQAAAMQYLYGESNEQ